MPGDEDSATDKNASPNQNPEPISFWDPDRIPNPNPDLQLEQPAGVKRKRNLPGTPDPDAEVVALSPKTLLSASTFVCNVCGKEFRRDQNLQIHRRGHNLPWNFTRKAADKETKKRVYVCPVETCVYHDPSRALGDLTGIKKHFSRKHGEKRWQCEKCSKKYAVLTDWKAHNRICGNREYECDCGTLFARKDSYIIHRASCQALAEEGDELSSLKIATSDITFNPNGVKNELLFPSLWGKVSEAKVNQNHSDSNTERAF